MTSQVAECPLHDLHVIYLLQMIRQTFGHISRDLSYSVFSSNSAIKIISHELLAKIEYDTALVSG